MERNVMDGFEWDIDDGGVVVLYINPHVAYRVFDVDKWMDYNGAWGNHPADEPQTPWDGPWDDPDGIHF
jgi:hypothetical protein